MMREIPLWRCAWGIGAVLFVSALLRAGEAVDAPWPTVHKDDQRSAYTEQAVAGPYERKWFRDFHDEMIATREEAILAEGKCFVGTFAGKLYAIDVTDGKTAWEYQTGGPIGASCCYSDGRVYVGSDDGNLYCLAAADGKPIWKYAAGASLWAAPVCDGKAVYVGDRAGVFHAVSVDAGKKLWTFQTGGMILTPASFSTDGKRIVFGSEDMHVYCLSPKGKQLWKSAKLGGLSMRDHAPTIWQGLAIVRTNPATGFHHAAGQNPAILTKTQKDMAMEEGDKVVFDNWGQYVMKLTPRRLKAEQEAILKFLATNPHEKTFYAFDLENGKEPWTAPVLYTGGLHNPTTPPTFNPTTGELFTWAPSALSNYSAGVPGGAIAVAKVDRKTGLTEILYHTNGERLGWAFDFVAPADETQALSLMAGVLLNTHQGIIGGMDLKTLKFMHVYIARDTYGGVFGPAVVQGSFQGADKAHAQGILALMCNEWHGPDRGVASIGYKRLFWVAGSQVVCIGGPDVARTETSGTKAPLPIRRKRMPVTPGGNVASGQQGTFDTTVPRPQITPDQLRKYLDAPPAVTEGSQAAELCAKLNSAVNELLTTNWAPMVIELGISGEDKYFWRTAETMQILAMALPHLSGETLAKAEEYLKSMLDAGAPLSSPSHSSNNAQRRELYDLGTDMRKLADSAPKYTANIEDFYALWACAHYANAWNRVLAQLQPIQQIFDAYMSKPATFDHNDKDNDAAEHLNAQIAGVLAYARIMKKAGKDAEVDRAMNRLAELVSFRVHHELADTNFVRATKTATYKLHQAKIPRYASLTPEVAQLLHDLAGEKFRANIAALSADLPVWHHAFGERLIGGENYISPPTLARGLFAALADGQNASPRELVSRLDQPWCRADLYYIEKLSALLRRAERQ